jgi:hypothetical protein
MGFLAGWTYRKKITIDYTKIDAALTDFPVLVKLTSSNFDFTKARSDGYDIRFTSSDGVTLLKYERERHDSTNSVAEYWVKIPFVSNTGNTEFYIYFGAPSASDGVDPTNVWDSNFFSVWHLNEASGNLIDSTANGQTLTPSGTLGYGTDAWVGKGINFSKANSASASRSSHNPGSSDYTVEIWIKPTSLYDYNEFLNNNVWNGVNMHTSANGTIYAGTNALQRIATSSGYISAGTGYYLAISLSSAAGHKFYKNGTLTHSNTNKPTPTWGTLTISNPTNYADSIIDEIRWSKVARPDAWIKATYYSNSDSLVSYGALETLNLGALLLMFLG